VDGERRAIGEAAAEEVGVAGVASLGIGLHEVPERDPVRGGVGHEARR
jgi:hypothetical protein